MSCVVNSHKNEIAGLGTAGLRARRAALTARLPEAGRVIPDHYRVDRSGQVLERTPGVKKLAIRALPDGGTVEEKVPPELIERLCLDDDQLDQLNRLADRCEHVYGPARDLEWAFADGELYLLQCRAVTRAGP